MQIGGLTNRDKHRSVNTMKKRRDLTQRGRNSIMVGIRVSNEVYGVLLEEAEKRGETVGKLIKRKVEAWVDKVNTLKG